MPITTTEPSSPAWYRRLYLPAYRVTDAARYVGAPRQTVASWHYSERGAGPVLAGRERGRPLSYFELVELAFVASFRQSGVPLQRIRRAHDYLAQRFQFEYPFAMVKLETDGTHVLMDLQEVEPETGVDQLIVTDAHGQLAWKSIVGERFQQFDYENDLAVRWHPAGPASSVVIDPRVSFGAPTVRGIPTWVVRGRHRAGETPEDITADFGLTTDEVAQALSFEGDTEAA